MEARLNNSFDSFITIFTARNILHFHFHHIKQDQVLTNNNHYLRSTGYVVFLS